MAVIKGQLKKSFKDMLKGQLKALSRNILFEEL